jgi:phosphate transport system permease protein
LTASTAPAQIRARRRPGDTVFAGAALAGGLLILVALAAVAIFLILQSLPAFAAKPGDITSTGAFPNFWAYVVPLVFGTIWAALLALLFAVPFSIGIALFISHYAPRRLARGLGAIIDLLAAVPSVVYGAWGIYVFAPFLQPFYAFLTSKLGWFPLFSGPASATGRR